MKSYPVMLTKWSVTSNESYVESLGQSSPVELIQSRTITEGSFVLEGELPHTPYKVGHLIFGADRSIEEYLEWAFQIGKSPIEWLTHPDPEKRRFAEELYARQRNKQSE